VSAALYDSVSRIARHVANSRALAGVGEVVDSFTSTGLPPDHAVSVRMRDSGSVLPRVPIAVGALGFAAIPRPGDLVIVLFLEGDDNAGVVVGRLYHSDLKPPQHDEGEVVMRLPPGSNQPDWSVVLSQRDSAVRVENSGKDIHLELTEELATLRVGKMSVTVESSGGGRAEVAAGGAVLTLKQDGDITLKTSGNFKLDATQIEIAASGKVKISGAAVEVN
jgi:uncharacterized protein involved in type VI secretion and phage assembly